MKLSIRDCLHQYAASLTKDQSARLNTVGASEVGQCLRKTWFSKNEIAQDEGYVDRYGAKLRGNLIEDHYWVPGLRSSLPEGVELLYAGDDQRTLVDGYLSATSDGLLVGVDRDCLSHLGIPDVGSNCLIVECKSIDPRVDIKIEKPEHSFQTHVQTGLVRFATEYKPNHALISYTDASFLDDVREFVVKFDPAIYQAAKDRARLVMTTEYALGLPAEGKLSGGDECRYCPWSSHCAHITVAGIPQSDNVSLSKEASENLKALRDDERHYRAEAERWNEMLTSVREVIKEFLRTHGIRKFKGEDWSVLWTSVKGRETVDLKAAEAAGIDLSPFKKVGDPADRLVVK